MLFNSLEFLIFYPVVTLVYYLLAQKYRWVWLLAASCYFYMFFKPIYILILGGTIVIDYFVGLNLVKFQGQKRKWLLVASIIANVGILAIFKYYNFFVDNMNSVLTTAGVHGKFSYLDILLPIGLSFHTFQAMSYTIEVYRGNQQPEKHFGIYALYVMFYPQLVAGPIERPQSMLHQFKEKKYFIEENVLYGLKLMLWGFFKKIVVADRLAVFVGNAYDNYVNQTGSTLLLATFFFAVQIYCDFSGYSDIARGAAKTMGFDLMINFRRPYLAANITDFWRRWHISLSSWFKDYVYYPLGGNKVALMKWCSNILIVFLLSGIWHGANWTFVIWGLIHGVVTIAHKLLVKLEEKQGLTALKQLFSIFSWKPLAVLLNFAIVTFAWVFFRAANVGQAFDILAKMFLHANQPAFGKTGGWMLLAFTGIIVVLAADMAEEYKLKYKLLFNKNAAIGMASALMLSLSILLFGIFRNTSFIYFQF
jgi:D-alanyl-lipoteichoic acid acyltransferase DltB (MBOAT superfamily)